VPVSIEVDIPLGENIVEWKEASGFADLKTVINVTDTMLSCISMNDGACSLSAPEPYLSISDFTIKGWLKVVVVVTDYVSWVEEKGGAIGILGNKTAVFEIKDGYAGIEDLGFIVTKDNVFNVKDYYAGIT